jgi:hypothetical protein
LSRSDEIAWLVLRGNQDGGLVAQDDIGGDPPGPERSADIPPLNGPFNSERVKTRIVLVMGVAGCQSSLPG